MIVLATGFCSVADAHAEDSTMSSFYHPPKDVDMASLTEPLCLERGTGMLISFTVRNRGGKTCPN